MRLFKQRIQRQGHPIAGTNSHKGAPRRRVGSRKPSKRIMRKLSAEQLEQRSMLACAFSEGTFTHVLPLLIDQSAQPSLVNFGTYVAPVDSKEPVSISFGFDDDVKQLLDFDDSSNLFSFDDSSYSFGNGETISPSLGARSLQEIVAEAGSLKSLVQDSYRFYAGAFLQGTIRMSMFQRIDDGQGGNRVCQRDETFIATRFISASNPGSNQVDFGLTSETSKSALELATPLLNSDSQISLSSSSSAFSADYHTIKNDPNLSPHVQYLAQDSGIVEVSVGTGASRTKIGELDAVAYRYKPRSIHIDKAALSNAIQTTFPFLSNPSSTADSILLKIRNEFTAGSIPATWVTNKADANVQVSFPQGKLNVYGKTDFEVPSTTIPTLREIIATRETQPIEMTRSNFSREVVKLLAKNKGKIIHAEVFADSIQRDIAAKYSWDSGKVEDALANVVVNQILHGIGFLGQISDEPEDRFSYDLMENLSKTGMLGNLTNDYSGFRTIGSKGFIKIIAGEGRSYLHSDDAYFKRPGWWENRYDVPAYNFAISCIAKDFVPQYRIYHDLTETPTTLVPDIEVENTTYNSTVLDFGNVDLGKPSETIYLKISNVGKGNLVISDIVVTGDFKFNPPIFPVSIRSPGWIGLHVEMLTRTEGSKTGSIAIYSNDPDEDPYFIFLKGVVTNPNKQGFLTVMTHGWNPAQSIDPDYVSGPWVSEYTTLMKAYVQKKTEGSVNSVVVPNVWDSGTGWNGAIFDAVVATVATAAIAEGCPVIVCGIIAQDALTSIPADMNVGSRLAFQSALKIKEIVEEEASKMVNPQIHLIGHSRGGAVSALASRLLTGSQKIAQLTVLDGYSYDWPNLGSILADTDIVHNANAARKANYMVQDGFAQILSDVLYRVGIGLGGNVSAALSDYLSTPDINDLFADWKAPPRDTFDINETINGYQPFATRSNHINISDLYFHSDTAEKSPKSFLEESPIGRWDPSAGGEGGGSDPQPPPLTESELASITDFYDGTFDQLGREQQLREQIQSLDVSSNPLFAAYQQISAKSMGSLSSIWKLVGKANVVSTQGNTLVELTAKKDTPSTIAQLVRIPSDAREVSLRVLPTSTSRNAFLRVLVDGAVVHQQHLAVWRAGTLNVALPASIGEMSEIAIEVSSVDNENDASIQVDDIQLVRPMKFNQFSAVPNMNPSDWSVHVTATANDNLNAATQAVQFYIENNGIPGLQPQSDFMAGQSTATSTSGNWETSLLHDRFSKRGSYTLYARPVGPVEDALVASTTIWVDSDYLPFHNATNPVDVDSDKTVSPLDALVVINFINSNGSIKLDDSWLPVTYFFDVNADSFVSPLDVLQIINAINRGPSGEGEADLAAADFESRVWADLQFDMASLEDLPINKKTLRAR